VILPVARGRQVRAIRGGLDRTRHLDARHLVLVDLSPAWIGVLKQ